MADWYAKLHFHSDGRMVLGKSLHASPKCRYFNFNEIHAIHKISGAIVDHMPKCKYCSRDVIDGLPGSEVKSKQTVVDTWSQALDFVRDLNNSRTGNEIRLTARQFKTMMELIIEAVVNE